MKNKYMPQLDGLRLFAVLFVMLNHWIFVNPSYFSLGYLCGSMGVDSFYVLSGFLISLILIDNKEKTTDKKFLLKQFYIRRFLRIFPLFYFVLFAGVILNIPYCRSNFGYLVTYLANIPMIPKHGDLGYFSHMWSLSVEEQFYLIFPFALLAINEKNIKSLVWFMIGLGIISRVISKFILPEGEQFWFSHCFTTASFDSFGFGLLLAYNLHYHRESLIINLKKYAYLFIIPTVLITAYTLKTQYDAYISDIFVRLSYSLIAYWVIGLAATNNIKGLMGKVVTNGAISYLGRITYGIYVYHYIVPYFFNSTRFKIEGDFSQKALAVTVFFTTTIILSAISFKYFENPVNKLKKYFEYNKKI